MEKFKRLKKTFILTSIITLLPIVVGLLLWDKFPDQMATHFDMYGEPDGWSSKGFTIICLPAMCFGIHLLCSIATFADPKNHRIGDKIFKMILWICPIVAWYCSISIYAHELGWNIHINEAASLLVGFMFIVVGNYLPKCRQNYTVGIKIPWTLNDEENWNHTHRFAGKLWMIGGAILLVVAFLEFDFSILLTALILTITLAPCVYSFLYYVKHK